MTDLTEKQQAFMDALFGDAEGNVRRAAELAGIEYKYAYIIVKKLKEEIIERAEYYLALHSPKAAMALAKGVDDDGSRPGALQRMAAAKEVLDRVGLSKKERVEVSGEAVTGIFILPRKNNE